MSHPQSCHLEEGGENGEAQEEEVEVSFEVGGVRRSLRNGIRDPGFHLALFIHCVSTE